MSGTLPDDVRYTDLAAADVAFLQATVPIDAKRKGIAASIVSERQTDGNFTVTIRFSTLPPAARAAAPVTPPPPPRPPTVAPPQVLPPRTIIPPALPPPRVVPRLGVAGSGRIVAGMTWFGQNFGDAVATAIAATPYSLELMTAIAVQETFEVWGSVFDTMSPAQTLQICVGDTLDAPSRTTFPRNKADLLTAPNGAEVLSVARWRW